MNANAKMIHADWLRTFRALEAYTNGFKEPLQGKAASWFLDGPCVPPGWVKNSTWAKSLIPRKHQAKVIPGIQYGAIFHHYQNKSLESITPLVDMCWNICGLANRELERIENLKK